MPPESPFFSHSRELSFSHVEKSEVTFSFLLEHVERKFLDVPYFFYTTPSGLTYTSAMSVEAAIYRVLVEFDAVDGDLRSTLAREIFRRHPEFARVAFARWGAYSNKQPIDHPNP
ncbi:MAG TPA: hypothetical protein VFG51_02465 [Candidatus Saccharimonadia bacterium]|nr:hypothetical protein [Candidatus Saccharimonadia bacterium]